MNTPVILYHGGGCHDGFTSAWVARTYFKEKGIEPKFVPCRYGEPTYVPEPDDGDIYLIDFSYKRQAMERLSKLGHRLIVLDHHKTALAELSAWTGQSSVEGKLHFGSGDEPVEMMFNLSECGATLAWDHFFPEKSVPKLLQYVRDRDLWRKELPHNDEVRAYMETLDFDFNVWDILKLALDDERGFDVVTGKGRVVVRYKTQQINDALNRAVPVELSGRKGWAVNSTVQFSEIAGKLAGKEGSTFGCAYFHREDGQWQYSLRARGEYTVDDIAKERGGGGHAQAAGFESEELVF